MSEEKKAIRDAYQLISDDYLFKKKDPWRDFGQFYQDIEWEERELLIDVGAGNGRNLHILLAKFSVALDLSYELLLGFSGPENSTRIAGALPNLPFRKHSADSIIMIAVLHHLPDQKQRKDALIACQLVLQDHGHMIISVWRKWRRGIREKILASLRSGATREEIDALVNVQRPWRDSSGNIIATRFYHYFTFRELEELFLSTNMEKITHGFLGGKHQDANIFLELRKNE